MDKLLNLIIIFIVIIFTYIVLYKKEGMTDNLYDEEDYSYLDDIFNNIDFEKNHNEKSTIKLKKKSVNVNPFFVEMRVHNDYRDTITAFNNVAPDQRPIFNRSVLPVKQIDVDPKEVKSLVKAFIKKVNEEVRYNVTDEIQPGSGWDELCPEKKKDSWSDYMNNLGLPGSIYNEPAKRAKIKLIKIDAVQKFATDDQLNFIVHMIIQKMNTSDQMIVKVSYIMDNIDLNTERNFNKKEFSVDFNVRIEEIAIVGFLTEHQNGDATNRKDFYEFVDIEKNNIIDTELVLKALKDKYKQRQIESDGFTLNIAPNELNDIAMFRLAKNAKLEPTDHTNLF